MERLDKILNTLNEYDKYLMRELREPTDKNVSLYEYWIDYKYDIEKQIEGMKNLEKQGKLLKLPCAVGDTVYQNMIVGVDKGKRKSVYETFKAKVFKFSLDSYTLYFWTETADEKKYQNEVPLSAFGKTVFLTKEEAEATLKEL